MKLKKLFFVLFGFALISCSKNPVNVDISYDSNSENGTLLVDGTTKINLPKDSLSITTLLLPGEHKFKLNNEKEFSATVAEKGGILNLNGNRFVTVTQEYGSGNELMNLGKNFRRNNEFIIADSIVFYYKEDSLREVSDAEIKNAITVNKQFGGNSNTMRLYEAQKFIPRDWDYGLNEDFPETIEEYTNKTDFYNTSSKTKILPLSLFSLMAYMTPNHFVVRKLKDIENSKTDKQEDRQKESKQMEMQ